MTKKLIFPILVGYGLGPNSVGLIFCGYVYSVYILVAFAIIKIKFEVIPEAKINSMIVELLLLNWALG